MSRRRHAEPAAGASLALMGLLALAHGLWPPFPAWPSGLAGWLAAGLLWPRLDTAQRSLALVLAGLGVAGLVWGASRTGGVDWTGALARNHAMLAMIAAVTFLRLVSVPQRAEAPGPAGGAAFRRTLLGLHLFSAVINVSAVMIVGDRLARGGALTRAHARLLSRAFSTAALWSPFFVAMATTLTYVPDARPPVLVAVGLALAACALVFTLWETSRADTAALAAFHGYPLRAESLRVPLLLALGVFVSHGALPGLSVLTLITALAPALTVALAWHRWGAPQAAATLVHHVRSRLPEMSGELSLFLAAGLFATGLAAIMGELGAWVPFARLTGTTASLTLLGMVLLAVIGVHPVISISALAVVLAPIAPDPNLLALTFLVAWSAGASTSPLSGLHLILQGRYGLRGSRLARWNLGYSMFLVALGAAVLHGYAWLG